ncbi:MBL fold metallo-hydrolase [Clostridium tagluense]|uniref:MBL fold metallo-hydrolase n=1 Tax=Clostridium tagluense TaxID=360422 RepID=A0A401UND6_9CLOT|nr:MBL fold metallo-hydrolase [Clostridium tagluense]GCD11053.1 MBL fold metallo-hydrolase [Clostridium tagluense]
MDEWFTIEEIDDETYAISEYGHWEKVHSYLLIGKTSALLIDTGLGIGNIKKEIDKLTELPVIVVTTHVHWDHIGGHALFNIICVHKNDSEWLKAGIPVPLSVIKKNVMSEPFSKNPPVEFNIEDYKIYTGDPTKILNDNDIIDIKQSIDKISSLKGITKVLPAHNELNVKVDLISSIKNAFEDIEDKGMLKQGNGIFHFCEFSIHI